MLNVISVEGRQSTLLVLIVLMGAMRFGMGRQMRWRMVLGVGEMTIKSRSPIHESCVIGVIVYLIGLD